MPERLQVEYAALTDVGRKRSHNEDSFKVAPDEGLYLVADGMGGHNAGEVASAMAVDVVSQFFVDAHDEPIISWPFKQARGERYDADTLGIAVQYANLRIYESSRESAERRGMGTTFVGALVRHGAAWVAHVGDSRGTSCARRAPSSRSPPTTRCWRSTAAPGPTSPTSSSRSSRTRTSSPGRWG
jgi:serine/threonine protein phosphatase PrpC